MTTDSQRRYRVTVTLTRVAGEDAQLLLDIHAPAGLTPTTANVRPSQKSLQSSRGASGCQQRDGPPPEQRLELSSGLHRRIGPSRARCARHGHSKSQCSLSCVIPQN